MSKKLDKLKVPKQYDRRIKLTAEQKVEIFSNNITSIHQLAKDYKVCRRTIQFIKYPERLQHHKELYQENRKDGRYYEKAKHTLAMKIHRQYKRQLLNENKMQ